MIIAPELSLSYDVELGIHVLSSSEISATERVAVVTNLLMFAAITFSPIEVKALASFSQLGQHHS